MTSMFWREFRTFFKTIWIAAAPILLSPLLFFGIEARCCYCILLMSCYWVAEVVPLAVTSFLPIFVFPFLAVNGVKTIAKCYFNDTNFMFFSSLMLSLAVEECQLHKRIALKMLTFVGSKPQWVMAGFMIITSFMENEEKLDVTRLNAEERGICKALMLIVAHASLIGGTGTINATGPNLIFRETIGNLYPSGEHGISYLSWMAFAIPPMIGYMASSWIVVQIQFIGVKFLFKIFSKSTDEEKQDEKRIRKIVHASYDQLGPMTWAEKSTFVIFVLTIASWITSDPKVIPGWTSLFPKGMVTDSCTGLFAVFMLFVWPKEKPDFAVFRTNEEPRDSVKRDALLTWDTARRKFPWSIIMLLGAGFAVSESVQKSGLSTLIACNMHRTLSGLPHLVMQACISVITVFTTEFSTNSATASIFIPISFNIAEAVRAHPLYFSIPAAIGPSFSFMLPMATPANAIVYETGAMRMIDMVSCGIFLNVFCIAITVLNMNTWAYWLFDMGTYPAYAMARNSTHYC